MTASNLARGSSLGPYEVTALLGEGGMGQVYRAADTNLKRQVALKVLPASVAADTDRLARFQREAEVLAALSTGSHDTRSHDTRRCWRISLVRGSVHGRTGTV